MTQVRDRLVGCQAAPHTTGRSSNYGQLNHVRHCWRGLAGAKAVEALRRSDFGGRIILFGDEEHLPYDRPPLSRSFWPAKVAERLHRQTSDWYRDHDVDVRLGVRVSSLDRSAHTVELPDGAAVRYDKLLLATGSAPRRPPIPGSDAAGVHYLRSYNDAVALNSVLVQGLPSQWWVPAG